MRPLNDVLNILRRVNQSDITTLSLEQDKALFINIRCTFGDTLEHQLVDNVCTCMRAMMQINEEPPNA
jgi:hypothetical protein